MDWQAEIDRHYPSGREVRDILLLHSRSVADLALSIARQKQLPLDSADIETAAMLHDIGIIATDAPGIDCHGSLPYLAHGAAGADMLRADGIDETFARVAERHTGAGLTDDEIADAALPLPSGRTYMPETLLERLICYADKFYSKTRLDSAKTLESVRTSMLRHSPATLERFDRLHGEFSETPSDD